jgi:hypothetical protein
VCRCPIFSFFFFFPNKDEVHCSFGHMNCGHEEITTRRRSYSSSMLQSFYWIFLIQRQTRSNCIFMYYSEYH